MDFAFVLNKECQTILACLYSFMSRWITGREMDQYVKKKGKILFCYRKKQKKTKNVLRIVLIYKNTETGERKHETKILPFLGI